MNDTSGNTTLVVGASRGLGHGIATAFARAGTPVVAVARTAAALSAPLTDLGRPAVQAYADRGGQTEEEYVRQFGEPLTPEVAGAAVVELVEADAATVEPAYLLTSAGLQALI